MGKTKSTTGPSKFAKPYISAAVGEATNVYNANRGANADIASRVQGLLPGLASRFEAGNPAVKAATAYNTDVLNGKFLDGGNPYLQGIIDNSNNDIRNQVQGSLGTRGRTGGDSYFGILSRELGKNETNLRYGDYAAERDRMGQAAGLAPGLANADYAGLQELLAASQLGAELPYAGVNDYVRNIGGLLGNSTTTTQKHGMGGLLAQAAGAGLAGWASGGFKGI